MQRHLQNIAQHFRRVISKPNINHKMLNGNDINTSRGKALVNTEILAPTANKNIDINNCKDVAKLIRTYDMLMQKSVNSRLDLLSPNISESEDPTKPDHKKCPHVLQNSLGEYSNIRSNHKLFLTDHLKTYPQLLGTEKNTSLGWLGQEIHQNSSNPKVEKSSNSNDVFTVFYKFPEIDDNPIIGETFTSNSLNNTFKTSADWKEENKLCSLLRLDKSTHRHTEFLQENQLIRNKIQFKNDSDIKPKENEEDSSENQSKEQLSAFFVLKARNKKRTPYKTKQDLDNEFITNINNLKKRNETISIKENKEDIIAKDLKEQSCSTELVHENTSDSKRYSSLEDSNLLLATNIEIEGKVVCNPNLEAEKTCSRKQNNVSDNNRPAEPTAACNMENMCKTLIDDKISLGSLVKPLKGNQSNEGPQKNEVIGKKRSVTKEMSLPRESEHKQSSQTRNTTSTCSSESDYDKSEENISNTKSKTNCAISQTVLDNDSLKRIGENVCVNKSNESNIKPKNTNRQIDTFKKDNKCNENKSLPPKLPNVATSVKGGSRGTRARRRGKFRCKKPITLTPKHYKYGVGKLQIKSLKKMVRGKKTTTLLSEHIQNMLFNETTPIEGDFKISVPGLNDVKSYQITIKPLDSNQEPPLKNNTSDKSTDAKNTQVNKIVETKKNTQFNCDNSDYPAEPLSNKQSKPIITKLKTNKSIKNQNITSEIGNTKVTDNEKKEIESTGKSSLLKNSSLKTPISCKNTESTGKSSLLKNSSLKTPISCKNTTHNTAENESCSKLHNVNTNNTKNMSTQNSFHPNLVKLTPEKRKLHSKKPETKEVQLKMYGTGNVTKVSSRPTSRSSSSNQHK